MLSIKLIFLVAYAQVKTRRVAWMNLTARVGCMDRRIVVSAHARIKDMQGDDIHDNIKTKDQTSGIFWKPIRNSTTVNKSRVHLTV